MAGDFDPAATALGGDLALDRLDILDGRKIEILAPDEGPQPLHHVGADRRIAGDRAGLDHCGAFPILPVTLVILLRSSRRERERCPAHVRPEFEVGLIHAALAGPVSKQGDEVANEAVQGFRGLAPPPVLHPLRVEQHEQAERARIGKLARAEPADTEHCQPAGRCGLIGVAGREGAPRGCTPKQMVERSGNCGIGKPGEGRRHLFRRPRAGDVGDRCGEQCPPLGRPEPLGEGATVTGAAGRDR